MPSLRVTAPDGSVRVVPLKGHELTIGRAPDNGLVLDGAGVSSHHCAFTVYAGQTTVADRGSTNGTFVNNAPLTQMQQSQPLAEHDRVYVGQYLLQVVFSGVRAHPPTQLMAAATPVPLDPGAPRILIQREDRGWRDEHNRIARYAEQWEQGGRADHLALRPVELRKAKAWLAQTPPERQDAITPTLREFIEASAGANKRIAAKRGLLVAAGVLGLGGLVTGVVVLWPEGDDVADQAQTDAADGGAQPEPPDEDDGLGDDDGDDGLAGDDDGDGGDDGGDGPRVAIEEKIVHEVIPEESLEDIARRYGVSVAQIAEWNLLNPDVKLLPPGTKVEVKRPKMRPLPQQQIKYELEPEDTSWTKLSKRFGVSAKKLRAYNPDVERLKRGQEVVIWVDPRPYKPKEPRTAIPSYVPETNAQSVGSPNQGNLENGIQLPDNDALYIRRYPYIMWGSGFLIANVQKAVAQFRQDMDFDGTLVLADISKQRGGDFYPPHRSHQAGRDIDIWLPTLRGVFKAKYLTEEGDEKFGRRPNPEEVDWFATWGLIKALLDTKSVQDIFITYEIQPNIYNAARYLGVSDEELDYAIQWPRNEHSAKGIVMHAPGHTHHMHVRFKCAPYEKRCNNRISKDAL
ncbi:penicillin-insensitive murein endopeptidase [Paraliomyxa miuraensis]|uniref:penicillin-insensitive murein endopeptidase n=1 Tax=Paraliomyxa miuraensis TaxID=376150 RepID=UPI0022518031|nr:penicillin-insensitive murein endopeptidase [Paraliomyxa miuraensis]MCX4246955.1 penicillin-insensitive murein endopeptidase [Paraliomyxa miuraensis]